MQFEPRFMQFMRIFAVLGLLCACQEGKIEKPQSAEINVDTHLYLVVNILPDQRTCIDDYKREKPCFAGLLDNGMELIFENGIKGYVFRPGMRNVVLVEELHYNSEPDGVREDTNIVEYRLLRIFE